MAELTFVTLVVLGWMMIIALVAGTVGFIVLVFHIVQIEIRCFLQNRRTKKAREELAKREILTLRRKKQLDLDDQFFTKIQEISNGL